MPERLNGRMFEMKSSFVSCRLIAAGAAGLVLATVSLAQPSGVEAEEPELAVAMAQLQYFTHKLALSVEARNAELARFYLHEAEETAELIRDEIAEYDGFPVGPLVGSMLLPGIERLEGTLEEPDWPAVDEVLGAIVVSCNACHQATDHGFIVIAYEPGLNPYMQSFEPQ
jgi:hypothetical protein